MAVLNPPRWLQSPVGACVLYGGISIALTFFNKGIFSYYHFHHPVRSTLPHPDAAGAPIACSQCPTQPRVPQRSDRSRLARAGVHDRDADLLLAALFPRFSRDGRDHVPDRAAPLAWVLGPRVSLVRLATSATPRRCVRSPGSPTDALNFASTSSLRAMKWRTQHCAA